MPRFEVTLAHRQTRQISTIEVEARSKDDLASVVDLNTYQIAGFAPATASTPHTAAATHAVKTGTADATIINLLASIEQRLDRAQRRKTGVISIMLGTFLGLCVFAVAAAIIALALGRQL